MKKHEMKRADTSSYDSSSIQIDVAVSTSNSGYNASTETRVVKVGSGTK